MTYKTMLASAGVLAIAALLAGPADAAHRHAAHAKRPMTPLQIVDTFDDMITSHHAPEAITRFIAPGFIEHDPIVPVDGRDGLLKYMHDHGWDKPGPSDMKDIIDREMADGPLVMVHHHIIRHAGERPEVYVDLFLIKNGLIQEHWDVMQQVPEHSDNKHTMY